MKRLSIFIIITLMLIDFIQPANAANVFACEPEWGALTKEIGGDKVSVTTAISAAQDPHHARAKPSLLAAIRKADLVICSGAGLEVGWLPVLLEKAGADVQPGKDGYISAANYVQVLDKPGKVDRSMGDVHPEGNPHLHLNPYNIGKIAKVLSEKLQLVDSSNSSYYQSRLKDFSSRWQQNIQRWENEAALLKGMKIIAHHENMAYLNDWLGLKQIGILEPKPGIPPTGAHLEELLAKLKSNPVKAIIRAPFEEEKASLWLAEKTGAEAIKLPFTVGAKDAEDLTALFDTTIKLLKGAN